MKKHILYMLFGILLVGGCKSAKVIPVKDDGKIRFTFVQVNDVYEIAPLNGGQYGGMARVAHVVDSIRAKDPNTYLFMAGDFLNPSLLGTVKVDGERLRGKHMIDVMNAMDFELATFGNHEFDLKEEELQQRLDESNFYWSSANVFQQLEDGPRSFFFRRNGDTIYIPETYTIEMMDADSTKIDVGLFSVTLNSNPRDYVYYADPFLEAESAMSKLEFQQTDVIVGLTHLKVDEDVALANTFPAIDLIMGGHEHNNMLVPTEHANIAKADANAKSIYIHRISHDKNSGETVVDSQLFPIDQRIASSPKVKAVVDKWNAILDDKIKEVVSNPDEVVYETKDPLDGTDSANRSLQTNLGEVVTAAMANAFDKPVQGALVNGGSFRLDDMLGTQVTSLDVFRVLPFGGSVYKVTLTGALLKEVLDFGKQARGSGAYLHRYGFSTAQDGTWRLSSQPIEDQNEYTIAFSDFLLKGYDIPFLTEDNKGVISIYKPKENEKAYDIRKAVIESMKSKTKN